MPPPPARAEFLFVTCQAGAERALKGELARERPELRFAYSRPGFVTFKLPEGHGLAEDFALGSVFARTYGFSLGRAGGETAAQRAASVWEMAGELAIDAVHVWPRDGAPGTGEEAAERLEDGEPDWVGEAREAILAAAPGLKVADAGTPDPEGRPPTERGQLVLDCVLIDQGEWWAGFHRARSGTSRWPGGLRPERLPEHAVSRAYLKMREALRWSKLPVARGDRCAELGCAPGGAAQYLLEQGLEVIGVDPAQVDPRVLADPRFTHLNKRGKEVRRRELRRVDWLFSDMNVAPNYTLDCVGDIVAHRDVNVRGLVLTLKLPDWKLADRLPDYLERIRGWGYRDVRARQLQHNRQEVCVAAVNERR